ncbi:hypothetical protein HBI49_055730 [Parastagonospora nodorum]|nr:hypothetical protein HBH43_048970 [Parastagonospora nodorum]KAH4186813.1 hypothetical protein HBI95_237080 [Parastagonospora nodorum]KAH4819617.1 hypothetical protein HBH61_027820 [Parastagonospora nodorum]KAH5374386.1 hypothetical protein HBI49_055730 [Parastagonospora nodorum]KAH5615350.1 hypothetical protein HBI45_020600 [Parastagonospora nodorum]
MIGDPSFVILKHSAWLDTSKYEQQILGSIIRQPLKPTNDYVPPKPLQYNAFDLVEPTEPLTDFVLENSSTDSKHARATLASIAHFDFKGETTESVKLAGKSITYKRLQQHTQFWNGLKTDKAVNGMVPIWVKDAKGWPPCLVVGIMIAEEVEVDFSGASQRETDGGIEAPIAKIAVAATGVPVALSGGNITVEGGAAHTSATAFEAKAGTSHIFALELQKVCIAKSSGWWSNKRKLVLADDGPDFDEGRLMDGGDSSSDDDSLLTMDDLEFGAFLDEEFGRMFG